ncbi:hydrogenase maturation nickel metallochaperone HypA [Frankia sp. AgKG'84/4]|uniref:hydrogenase maturation nickel metallochaperone HypA n=1 Tax=Frankia sp. AgKG'84/4 TaxID=573490 RepID=UPI0020107D20|nr:hydrogenase maturation nickel metallochaperone HypA [Frankia sp. AgKG'84/4]MCL9795606.1 hydrogenase maturation nickel metallochaperone HypA [Frankia sp. AgKG'84/4]
MHELSICRSVAEIVSRHAAGRRVSRVRLRVGALRQVVPATLVHCWNVAYGGQPAEAGVELAGSVLAGSVLAGSVLEVESVPARVRCRGCGERRELVRPSTCCPACGTADVELIGGEEFLVTSFDVEPLPAAV